MAYFVFFEKQQSEVSYRKYTNGIEGIRQDGAFRCPLPITRIAPPVPDYSTEENGSWHYHSPQTLPDNLIEYKDGSSHPVDDCWPSKQLEYMINKCGQPDIIYETEHDGKTSARDANDTWNKLQ